MPQYLLILREGTPGYATELKVVFLPLIETIAVTVGDAALGLLGAWVAVRVISYTCTSSLIEPGEMLAAALTAGFIERLALEYERGDAVEPVRRGSPAAGGGDRRRSI